MIKINTRENKSSGILPIWLFYIKIKDVIVLKILPKNNQIKPPLLGLVTDCFKAKS